MEKEKHINHNNGKIKAYEAVVRYLESEKNKILKMKQDPNNKVHRAVSLSAAARSTANYLEYFKSKLENQKLK